MFGFIILFVSFLAITISYSRAFKIKNDVTSIIEKYGGFNATALQRINNYIRQQKYRSTGSCDVGANELGVNNLTATNRALLGTGKDENGTDLGNRYYYCVHKYDVKGTSISNVYYEVTMFYHFNLPIVGDAATFRIKGKTTDMVNPNRSTSTNWDLFFSL